MWRIDDKRFQADLARSNPPKGSWLLVRCSGSIEYSLLARFVISDFVSPLFLSVSPSFFLSFFFPSFLRFLCVYIFGKTTLARIRSFIPFSLSLSLPFSPTRFPSNALINSPNHVIPLTNSILYIIYSDYQNVAWHATSRNRLTERVNLDMQSLFLSHSLSHSGPKPDCTSWKNIRCTWIVIVSYFFFFLFSFPL